MRATGIVRRIDDLGRVVIPKEIRRTLRIREGDPLEIFTDREGYVAFKPYRMMEGAPADTIIAAMKKLNIPGFMVDRDKELMAGRRTYQLPADFNMDSYRHYQRIDNEWSAYPVLLDGELLGSIIFRESSQDEYNIIHGIVTAMLASMEV